MLVILKLTDRLHIAAINLPLHALQRYGLEQQA
jgi:hypothetical protein